MSTSGLMDFLAGDALTKLAQAFAVKPGLVRPLPPAFYKPGPTKPVGTVIEYDLVNGSRESAKITNPDSPSQVAQGITTERRKVVSIGAREHYPISLSMIQALQYPGDMVRMNAKMELERQVKAFVDRFINTRTNAVHAAVIGGKIDVSSDGDIQVTASSPVRTLDFRSDTATRLTSDGSGSTYTIGDWSSASTDIVTAVAEFKRYMSKTYGYTVTECYYGTDIPNFLAKNTVFKEYLARHEVFRNGFVGGEIPNGILGLNWHPVGTATSVTDSTATSWAADNFLAFSPPPDDTGWYEMVECGLPAPVGITSDGEIKNAMLSPESLGAAFPIRYGVHSYTLYSADPIQAKLVVADFACPIIKAKNAMARGTCS